MVQQFVASLPVPNNAAQIPDGQPVIAVAEVVEEHQDSTSSDSQDDGEHEEAALIDPQPAPAAAVDNLLFPHSLQWHEAEQPVLINAHSSVDFEPLVRWKVGQSSLPSSHSLLQSFCASHLEFQDL